MEDLEISTKRLKNFDEMREKVKEHLRGCQTDAGGCNPRKEVENIWFFINYKLSMIPLNRTQLIFKIH